MQLYNLNNKFTIYQKYNRIQEKLAIKNKKIYHIYMVKNIIRKNFSIIAHIDHGKSTLADRLMEFCNAVEKRKLEKQMLDTLEVEKQRGITVKSQTVRLDYNFNGQDYVLNLIDTPGHVDFSLEVRRALAASEGAIILIDATQGVEAQTLANVYRAMEEDLLLIPVINKIDLQSARIDFVKDQIVNSLGIMIEPALVSAKTGIGIEELMQKLAIELPEAEQNIDGVFKALLIDSWFDPYLGVVLLIRVKEGKVEVNNSFKFHSNGCIYKIEKLGFLRPQIQYVNIMYAGDVGIVIANIRTIKDCVMGDTLCDVTYTGEPVKSFPKQKAVVFCGLFPADQSLYGELKDAIEKLSLNDSSLKIETAHSPALGVGFRCGFLGLLHLEVTQQRLEQEFNVSVIITAPNVQYKVHTADEIIECNDASFMPNTSKIKKIFEPWVKVTIFSPDIYLGEIIKLCLDKRGTDQNLQYVNQISETQNISCQYNMPLSEIIFDFHDKLKSLTKGYASFDYEEISDRETEVSIVDILINGTPVESLSVITHKDSAQHYARWACETFKEALPRQMFAIAIQAAIGGKIIARESISAYKKDVIAKCYGGDVTRKKKLLEKQKEGKKKMKELSVGNVNIPNSAILKVLTKKG